MYICNNKKLKKMVKIVRVDFVIGDQKPETFKEVNDLLKDGYKIDGDVNTFHNGSKMVTMVYTLYKK